MQERMPAVVYLINPSDLPVSIVKVKASRWNRYSVWKPLSLMVLADPTEGGNFNLRQDLWCTGLSGPGRPDLAVLSELGKRAMKDGKGRIRLQLKGQTELG